MMRTDENKALVRLLLDEGFNANNGTVFDELLAEDFANHDPSQPTAVDREGLTQFWAALCAGFPDQHTVVDDLIAEGDRVVKRATWRGRHTGEFHGLPPTGRPVINRLISIYRIEDGRVKDIHWGYDNLTILQQLGVIPVPQAAGV